MDDPPEMVTRSILLGSLGTAVSLVLVSCANSPFGASLERSLQADPRLTEQPGALGGATVSPSPTPIALPANFPDAIPLYPEADLISVAPGPTTSGTSGSPGATGRTETLWSTLDGADQVREFYRTRLSEDGWQLASTSPSEAIAAERDGVQVQVVLAGPSSDASTTPDPSPSPSPGGPSPSPGSRAAATEFTLSYRLPNRATDSTRATPTDQGVSPSASGTEEAIAPAQSFSDVGQAPEELQSYIEDLGQLGGLPLGERDAASANLFQPSQPITRRDYARWLLTTNNRLYRDRPANKIRLGVESDQPAFQDVPKTDPDFAIIQGLAEAGIVPSPLSGASTTVTFRPNAPLTREDMLLWKLPLDLRRTLPNATVQAVQETWGFQDAARIDPSALRAVLADYQNGDLSNIRRAFGFTTLLQPERPVTRAEAAATLWYFGAQGDGLSARDALTDQPTPSPDPSLNP